MAQALEQPSPLLSLPSSQVSLASMALSPEAGTPPPPPSSSPPPGPPLEKPPLLVSSPLSCEPGENVEESSPPHAKLTRTPNVTRTRGTERPTRIASDPGESTGHLRTYRTDRPPSHLRRARRLTFVGERPTVGDALRRCRLTTHLDPKRLAFIALTGGSAVRARRAPRLPSRPIPGGCPSHGR